MADWYREKEATTEVMQFTKMNLDKIKEFTDYQLKDINIGRGLDGKVTAVLTTLMRVYEVNEGDYITRRAEDNTFEVLSPDLFHDTYERVGDEHTIKYGIPREKRMEELKIKIKNKGFTQKEMAEQLGITRNGFIKKLDGTSSFWLNEVIAISQILGLTRSEEERVFFDRKTRILSRRK